MVQPIVDVDTFVIWLGTNPFLRKIKEVEKNPNITLAFYSDKEHANLIIYGKASIVREVQEKKSIGSVHGYYFFLAVQAEMILFQYELNRQKWN